MDLSPEARLSAAWTYTPILKGKAGEYEALRVLDPKVRAACVPIIVLVPGDERGDTARTLAVALDGMRSGWGRQGPLILDGGWLEIGEFALCLEAASAKDWLALVSARLSDPEPYLQLASESARRNGVVLRLSQDELADNSLRQGLERVLRRLGVEPAEVDLVLDFRVVEWHRLGSASLAAVNGLRTLPWITAWRHLTLAATNAPASLREFEPNTITDVARTEVLLYREVERHRADLLRLPNRGDYAVAHPDPVEDQAGSARNMATQFRYSTDEQLRIVKASRFTDTSGTELPSLLGRLVEEDGFSGRGFSAGDWWAADVAAKKAAPGNARQWRQAATNHHLTLEVMRPLAMPSGT